MVFFFFFQPPTQSLPYFQTLIQLITLDLIALPVPKQSRHQYSRFLAFHKVTSIIAQVQSTALRILFWSFLSLSFTCSLDSTNIHWTPTMWQALEIKTRQGSTPKSFQSRGSCLRWWCCYLLETQLEPNPACTVYPGCSTRGCMSNGQWSDHFK